MSRISSTVWCFLLYRRLLREETMFLSLIMDRLYAKPRKRSLDEANEDDQTNDDSDLLLQQEDKCKRVKLDSVSDTTLEYLPIELLEYILVKVVVMEVKGLKLAKSVWEDKADLVISRLRTVCPQWNSILTTNYFRKKLHRTFASVQQMIRLEIVHEFTIQSKVIRVTTVKDDIFMLSSLDLPNQHDIKVYDRNNMAEVKDVIPLPVSTRHHMRGCSVSNCVYVLIEINNCISVLRINKDATDKLQIAPWEYDHKIPISTLLVSANGNLLVISMQEQRGPHFAGIYNANGSLEHRIELPRDNNTIGYNGEVTQISNGNLIMGTISKPNYQVKLLEIDMNGSVVRQYATSLQVWSFIHCADAHGRILITEPNKGMKLLDSEFNLLGEYSLQQDEGKTLDICDLHYESGRNEIIRHHYVVGANIWVLTIFRFTED